MMLFRLVLLPLLSLGGVGLAAWSVRTADQQRPPTPGLTTPPLPPFSTRVAATGVVEAASRNVELGVARSGLVTGLEVDIGDRVEKGELLLQIDDRDAQAMVVMREAELAAARAEVFRLESLPRPEEVTPRQAAVAQRRAQAEEAEALLALVDNIADARAVSREERARRAAARDVARSALAEAEAQLALVQAGAWRPELEIARARVTTAEAALASAQVELDQLQLRAPFAGKVLQLNVRLGEFATAGPNSDPVLVLGDVSTLHVRADVDEMDVWRLSPGAAARAFVRGNRELSAPLRFVAVEPLMVPKRSLSGASRELIDTRVLQVLYALDPDALPVQVGQLVDVFVEAEVGPGGGK